MVSQAGGMEGEMVISMSNVNNAWPDGNIQLQNVNMQLPKGSRSIIVGANGAGKTCLLRTIGGVYAYQGEVNVLGQPAYRPTRLGTSGATEVVAGINVWRHGDCVIVGERWQPRGDSKVSTMLDFVEGWVPERRDIIVDRFGIDLDWKVNQLSDGRKRRVQLLLALARPAEILLLDEVTTDLDVLARQTLLDFLKEESEQRGCTVLFSTHIFDGLEDWGTHITYVRRNTVDVNGTLDSIDGIQELKRQGNTTPLYSFVGASVRKDAEEARASGRKSTRCAHAIPMVITN